MFFFQISCIVLLLSGMLFAQEAKNPFVSVVDKIRYEKYQRQLKEKQLEEERRRREQEKKRLERELKQQEEREKRVKEQLRKEEKRRQAIERNRQESRSKVDIAKLLQSRKGPVLEIKQEEIGFPEFSLQGIIYYKNSPRVVINNNVYAKGDRLLDKIDIVKIEEHEVHFLYNKEVFVRSIPPKGNISIKQESKK